MGVCRHCRACAQLARALAVPAGRPACRLARRGLALNWLVPLPFLPVDLPAGSLGAMVFVLALALVAWAIVTITRAGSNVPTNLPTTTIVESGPYRFTRNPIYLGMFLGLIGLAIAFDNLWLLVMLVPFAFVIRYGVVAREEDYLERKFGDVYRSLPLARTALAVARHSAHHVRPEVFVFSDGCAALLNMADEPLAIVLSGLAGGTLRAG